MDSQKSGGFKTNPDEFDEGNGEHYCTENGCTPCIEHGKNIEDIQNLMRIHWKSIVEAQSEINEIKNKTLKELSQQIDDQKKAISENLQRNILKNFPEDALNKISNEIEQKIAIIALKNPTTIDLNTKFINFS